MLKETNLINTSALGNYNKLNTTTGASRRGLGYSQQKTKNNQENLCLDVKDPFFYSFKSETESPFNSKNLEKRYNKLNGKLETMSKKIQDVIDNSID